MRRSWLVVVWRLAQGLAIVMDTYGTVKSREENPITIWHQAAETYQMLQDTKGHLGLWYSP